MRGAEAPCGSFARTTLGGRVSFFMTSLEAVGESLLEEDEEELDDEELDDDEDDDSSSELSGPLVGSLSGEEFGASTVSLATCFLSVFFLSSLSLLLAPYSLSVLRLFGMFSEAITFDCEDTFNLLAFAGSSRTVCCLTLDVISVDCDDSFDSLVFTLL